MRAPASAPQMNHASVSDDVNRWDLEHKFHGKIVKRFPWSTASGQAVEFVLTTVAGYALRIFFERDKRFLEQIAIKDSYYEFFSTKKKALAAIETYKSRMMAMNMEFIVNYENERVPGSDHMQLLTLDNDAITNPDKYLRPGDHIYTPLSIVLTHQGIYIGNKRVIHVTGREGGILERKKKAIPRETELCPAFVKAGEKLQLVVYRILVRTKGDIVDRAQNGAAAFANWKNLGSRWVILSHHYNILFNNCQHFTKECCVGHRTSDDVHRLVRFLRGLGIGTTSAPTRLFVMIVKVIIKAIVTQAPLQTAAMTALTSITLPQIAVAIAIGAGGAIAFGGAVAAKDYVKIACAPKVCRRLPLANGMLDDTSELD